jgi:hypothetical protein
MWGKELGPDLKGVLPKSFSLKKESASARRDLLRECSHGVIMMGTQRSEAQLFSYAVNSAKRMRANHRLRQVKQRLSPTILSRRSPCLGRSSFARQKRKEFRGEFAPFETVANFLRPAHRSSVSAVIIALQKVSTRRERL